MTATADLHDRYRLLGKSAKDCNFLDTIPEPYKYQFGADRSEMEVKLLRAHVRKLFLIDEQRYQLIRKILGAMEAQSRLAFSTIVDIRRRLQAENPWDEITALIICLTGLAGVGKTSLLNALDRYLIASCGILVGQHPLPIPLTSPWILHSVTKGTGLAHIFAPLDILPSSGFSATTDNHEKKGRRVLSSETASRRCYRSGVCGTVLDELQRMSASLPASTMVTNLVLQVSALGPVTVYSCNYSLLHKLASRNHEERDRLLAERLLLRPYISGTADWSRYLNETLKVLGNRFELNAESDEVELHEMTFGLPRKLENLLCLAYVEATRRAGKFPVVIADVRKAFSSADYAASRSELGTLALQINARRGLQRDLYSPLDDVDGLHNAEANGLDQARDTQHSRALEHAAQLKAMTPSEREEHGKEISRQSPLLSTFKGKKPRRPKRVAGDLEENRAVFDSI